MLTAERAHTLVSSIVVFALTTFFAGALFLFLTPASSERTLPDHIDSVSHVQGQWLLLDGSISLGQPELPFAVMIDNRPEGRPQSGLSEARAVYETLVEGGTTRIMAVFQNSDTLQTGPVRSARPYFISLVRELDAAYVHSGGSPGALASIEDSEVPDIEEISSLGTKYFWRDTSVSGPYNLFTSSPGLRGAAEYLDYATSTTQARIWHFAPVVLENEMSLQDQRVLVDWSAGVEYDVAYEYNPATARYERWIADRPHIDRTTSRQLTVANIVVQRVPAEQVLDDIGRLAIDVEGAGEAIIFRHGKAVHGSWRKQHAVARTLFFDESGREIDFVPGTIWVEIVPGDRKVSIE